MYLAFPFEIFPLFKEFFKECINCHARKFEAVLLTDRGFYDLITPRIATGERAIKPTIRPRGEEAL